MQVVDAQIHGVGPWSDWNGETSELQKRILTELAVAYLDAVGVNSAVLFPARGDVSAPWAAEQLPDRFAYVSSLNPDEPDIDGAVRAAKARPHQLAVRAVIGFPVDGTEVRRFEAGAWDPIFAACERHEVPLFLFLSGWLEHAADIARRYPGLTLIVDHIGIRQPPLDTADDPPFKTLPQLLELAKFPQVSVKLCGLPALSREPFPYNDVAPRLRAIVDAFGADRLMWASDTTRFAGRFGLHRSHNPPNAAPYQGKHTYAESLHFIRNSDVLTAQEKEAILGGTVRRVLGWPAA
jgi:L-fuconolactonase